MYAHTTIEKYSHFFVVKHPTPAITKIIYSLSANYTQFGMIKDPKTHRNRWAPMKTFAVYVDGGAEFRFHINQFKEFHDALQFQYIDKKSYTVLEMELYTPATVDLPIKEGWKLYDQQEEASSFILDGIKEGRKAPLLMMPTGSGKAAPLDALVKIPGGWAKIGDMAVGTIVTAWDGTPTVVTGVYPQGLRKTARMQFEDGRSTICDLEHLWRVYRSEDATEGEVVTTEQLIEYLKTSRCFIDLIIPEDGPGVKTTEDLYAQGVRWALGGPIDLAYRNGNYAQRLALAQGLLDTVGHIDTDDMALYLNWNIADPEKEGKQVEYLFRSLGAVITRQGTKRSPAWKIRHSRPVSLFRHRCPKHLLDTFGDLTVSTKLELVEITPDKTVECQCISIDHPDRLYVTDDFIVTHNTVTALITTSRIGYRFAVVVLAGYVDKWIKDIKNTLDIDEKEIGVIDGGKKLSRSTFYPSSDLPTPKAFVISLNTITRWYGLYEERRTNPQLEAYDCLPWMFWEHLGIGTVIFDEVHQHFHAVYRTYSYLHVPVAINLSATLLSKDQTIRKVHGMMFPQTKRFDKIKMKRYITTWACAYQITDFARSRLQTTDYGSNTYSQNAFEMSILRHKTIKTQYVKMILDLVERAYVDRYAKGDKLIIFVGRSMMAHKLVDELRKRWPQFSARTFLEGDPPENMHEPDIRVTTVISGSTAHDIANLRVAIMTNSIDSPVANLQALGRLREMKHRTEHADVHFYYVYCSTIPKQHEYHLNRHELFSDRTLEQKKLFLGTITP